MEPSASSHEISIRNHDTQETIISKRRPEPLPFGHAPTTLEMGDALVGTRLGHFQLEEFIGGGGMGAVFRAMDTELGRIVAVKVLSRDQSDEEILRRFKNEAQSAARLDHDNIARVHYVGEDKGWNYIVFEYIEGVNIRDLVVGRGPLPLAEAINYTLQVAEALEHAHRRDVVHRDIKPSNVIITGDGHVKLVDMGLARLHQVESANHDLTASGVTLGTFDYISPEQARDPRSADVRSDIYSLGCTLYFMLTARPPFPEGTVLQKLLSHTSDERPDPRIYRPDMPEEIIAVLNKMLARSPAERYQRPNEMIGELLLVADQLGLEGASHGGTVWITPNVAQPSLLERLIPVVVPVVLLIAAVLGLEFYLSRPATPELATGPALLPPIAGPEAPAVAGDGANVKPVAPNATGEKPGGDGTAEQNPNAPGNTAKTGAEPGGTPPVAPGSVPRVPVAFTLLDNASDDPSQQLLDELTSHDGLGPPQISARLGVVATKPDSVSALVAVGAMADGLSPAELSQTAVQGMTPIANAVPRRIIVGDPLAELPKDAQVAGSLDAAVKLAADNPQIDTIELHYNGFREASPMRMTSAKLHIIAGTDFRPGVVFRPVERDFASDGRMVHVVGGEFTWLGIDVQLDMPMLLSGEWSWSLFHVDHAHSLDLQSCTLTIANLGSDGGRLQRDVSFFSVQEPPNIEMPDRPEAMATRPSINLTSCIARGQATLVEAEHVTPFVLAWDQGLLITSERLLETGGAVMKPKWDGQVEIYLTHVTAVMQSGMCWIGRSEAAPIQLPLFIKCHNCILKPDSPDVDVPLIEHLVADDATDLSKLLDFRSDSTFFPSKSPIWRLSPGDGLSKVVDIDIEKASVSPWFKVEKNGLPGRVGGDLERVQWSALPADDVPVHQRTLQDYKLMESGTNPASPQRRNAGFHENLLPGGERMNESPAETPLRPLDSPSPGS